MRETSLKSLGTSFRARHARNRARERTNEQRQDLRLIVGALTLFGVLTPLLFVLST